MNVVSCIGPGLRVGDLYVNIDSTIKINYIIDLPQEVEDPEKLSGEEQGQLFIIINNEMFTLFGTLATFFSQIRLLEDLLKLSARNCSSSEKVALLYHDRAEFKPHTSQASGKIYIKIEKYI